MHSYLICANARRHDLARFIAVTVVVFLTSSAQAEEPVPSTRPVAGAALISGGMREDGQIHLMVNGSQVITTAVPHTRVSIGQPDLVAVTPLTPNSLLLTGHKPGTTQLVVWDAGNQSQMVDVVVEMDLRDMERQYRVLFPEARIDIAMVNGQLVLRGRVPNLMAAEQAAQVASSYGKPVNLLEVAGGQQVMLQVRFAEVSRSASSALGVNLAYNDGHSFGASNVGQVSPFALDQVGKLAPGAVSPTVTLFGRAEAGNTALEAFISALRQNNLLRMLAEPNLIATSGEQASFLAGGEFPIPVPQGGSAGTGSSTVITIEFKEFGVKLNFTPVVLGDGRIRLKVAPEVSDLDFTTAVRFNGFVVPGLTQRKLATTVELGDGQTLALAGLLNNSIVANKDVTPALGDVPVLGALFRSVSYQRKQTELVVLVTPRLVSAMNPGQVPPLPGEKWRYPTEGDLFLRQDLGGPAPDAQPPHTVPVQGGFAPATNPAR